MEQTPVHEQHNPDLLKLIPIQSKNLIEVGCSSGVLAGEFKKFDKLLLVRHRNRRGLC
jgi:hypothetical protein